MEQTHGCANLHPKLSNRLGVCYSQAMSRDPPRSCCRKGPPTSSLAHPKEGDWGWGSGGGRSPSLPPFHWAMPTSPDPELQERHCGNSLLSAGRGDGRVSVTQAARGYIFFVDSVRVRGAPEMPRSGGHRVEGDRPGEAAKQSPVWDGAWGGRFRHGPAAGSPSPLCNPVPRRCSKAIVGTALLAATPGWLWRVE